MKKIVERVDGSAVVGAAAVSRACEEAAAFLGYRVESGEGRGGAYTVLVDERSGETRVFSSRSALSAALCLELMEAAGFRNAGQIEVS